MAAVDCSIPRRRPPPRFVPRRSSSGCSPARVPPALLSPVDLVAGADPRRRAPAASPTASSSASAPRQPLPDHPLGPLDRLRHAVRRRPRGRRLHHRRAVYIFGLKDYHPIVRPAVLTGFLGYFFAVLGLLCDLGQPWESPYPIVYTHGTTSVMFEVGLVRAPSTSRCSSSSSPRRSSSGSASEGAASGRSRLTLGADRPRHGALDAAPVVARRAVPDGARQAPPALVLRLPPGLLLHLEPSSPGSTMVIVRERALAPGLPRPRRPQHARGPRRPHARPRQGRRRSCCSPTSS